MFTIKIVEVLAFAAIVNCDDFQFLQGSFDNRTAKTFESHETSFFDTCTNQSSLHNRQSSRGVYTQSGYISGDETKKGFSFRGVPYAEPPVGKLRFAPPQYFKGKWPSKRAFTEFGAKCAQFNHIGYKFEGDEDCLTLNIFVPRKIMTGNALYPVIVFIHGGSFMFGGSQYYGAENFYDDARMILVTINYRLGILGFLSTEDDNIPGNYGLKDQVEALKWVQKNIKNFNGDPKRVTLSGFLAGAASVHLHMMSPLSKGLFTNGISHSGNALDPWVMQKKAQQKAFDISARFGCRRTVRRDWLSSCLRKVDIESLVMYASHFQGFMYNPFSPFGVVIEKSTVTGAFITDDPRKIVKNKGPGYQSLPWILSQTDDEGLYPVAEFIDSKILKTFDRIWDKISPHLFDYVSQVEDPEKQASWTRQIKDFYLQSNPIDMKRIYVLIKVRCKTDKVLNVQNRRFLDDDRQTLPQRSLQLHKKPGRQSIRRKDLRVSVQENNSECASFGSNLEG
jgi:carboxylesterase type B